MSFLTSVNYKFKFELYFKNFFTQKQSKKNLENFDPVNQPQNFPLFLSSENSKMLRLKNF